MKHCIALLLLLALSFTPPLRLHVVASSDSALDQSIKLEVRDAVLEQMNSMPQANSLEEAQNLLLQNGAAFQQAADQALADAGAPYGARMYLGKYDFPRREYEGKVYPAGTYDAMRVVLGDGGGQNWWCVMFPPLCIGENKPRQKVQFRSVIVDAVKAMGGKK